MESSAVVKLQNTERELLKFGSFVADNAAVLAYLRHDGQRKWQPSVEQNGYSHL